MNDSLNNLLSINIDEYAHSVGYTQILDGKKSSNWITLKNPNTNDNIRIFRPKQLFFNNDPNLEPDKGNIISFTLNRLTNIVHINKNATKEDRNKSFQILKEYLGEVSIEPVFNVVEKIKEEKDYVRDILKNVTSCTSYSFNHLTKFRSLNPDIVNEPIFKNQVLESNVKMYNGKIIGNICFTKRNDNNDLIGIVSHFPTVNKETNTISISKRVYELEDLIWKSNIPENPYTLFYGESAIDCLSHYNLFPEPTAFYASTEGQSTTKKVNELFSFFSSCNRSHGNSVALTSITDNDYSGYLFDRDVAISFYNKFNPENPIEVKQEVNFIKYIFHKSFEKTDLNVLKKDLLEKLEVETKDKFNLFKPYLNVVQLKDFTVIEVPHKLGEHKVSYFLQPLIQAIHKENNINFKFNKTEFNKDWNDNLKSIVKEKGVDFLVLDKKKLNESYKLNLDDLEKYESQVTKTLKKKFANINKKKM